MNQKLSVNPKLITPAAGQIWVMQSQASNPFNKKSHMVTVTQVKSGWVKYCYDLKKELSHAESITDFQMAYQPDRI